MRRQTKRDALVEGKEKEKKLMKRKKGENPDVAFTTRVFQYLNILAEISMRPLSILVFSDRTKYQKIEEKILP